MTYSECHRHRFKSWPKPPAQGQRHRERRSHYLGTFENLYKVGPARGIWNWQNPINFWHVRARARLFELELIVLFANIQIFCLSKLVLRGRWGKGETCLLPSAFLGEIRIRGEGSETKSRHVLEHFAVECLGCWLRSKWFFGHKVGICRCLVNVIHP